MRINKQSVSWLAFLAILFLCCSAFALYSVNMLKWIELPDRGFIFRAATGIHIIGDINETGKKAGLRKGDVILKINGKSYETFAEFCKNWNHTLGSTNRYLIERGGHQLQVSVENVPIGAARVFGSSGIPFFVGLIYVLVGSLVFLMKPHRGRSWVFFGFTVTSGLVFCFFLESGPIYPPWLDAVMIFGLCFLPATIIHLILYFPEKQYVVHKWPTVSFCGYVLSTILFACVISSTASLADMPELLRRIVVLYIALSVVIYVGGLFLTLYRTDSHMARLRAKMILLGFGVSAILPASDFLLNELFGVYIIPQLVYYPAFFVALPVFIGYSIVKHDLFEIDDVIKRTYGYVLATGGIAVAYGLVVGLFKEVFGKSEITRSNLFPIAFALGAVSIFNPLRNRMQRLIDEVFYRLEYDYKATVEKISEAMRSFLNVEEIGKRIVDLATRVLFVDYAGVLIFNEHTGMYEYLAVGGTRERLHDIDSKKEMMSAQNQENAIYQNVELISQANREVKEEGRSHEGNIEIPKSREPLAEADPLIQKMKKRKKEITVYGIEEDPFFEDQKEASMRSISRMDATLLVPLIYEEDLIGLIALGEKKSGKFYFGEDIALLKTLANQAAVAIENAKLFQENLEKQRMEEELNIARNLQMSMLPKEAPKVEGLTITAHSSPAREVGGDFFDFIEMGDEQVGLVIGDVTGKSVSGALVMAASRSVFRMLSEEQLSVGEIMMRANRRIKKDVTGGMFVALLYAVLDGERKTLRLCSAGQTQPVHFSTEEQDAYLIQTEGDTFPLGILEEAIYQETQIQLQPGDKLVFYTDGIVEAMNEREEMFGFERLLDCIRSCKDRSADETLSTIIQEVNSFAGKASQHDDITLIIVGVR
ncbi:MAG: hypothetical protein DRH12_11150 [Deltaproteobacteria bacterium]|nr:MAG: hypothetical protein DRH12_11150 [Deltaproteobacteria bacterium]